MLYIVPEPYSITFLPFSACVGQELHEFLEQYSEVVRNQASVTLKITKCTTIGPPRIGKTCLKHLLTGQEWDMEAGTASTDVMEAPVWVECYSVEGGAEKLWKLVSREQQDGELIRAINTLSTSSTQLTTAPSDAPTTTTPSSAPTTITPSDVQHPTTPSDTPPSIAPRHATTTTTSKASDVIFTATLSDTEFETTPSSLSPLITMADAAQKPANVWQALEALASAFNPEDLQEFLEDKAGKVLGETHLVHFIDTGGQAIYHDVHPVLITSPSVYLVVFSLADLYNKSDKEQLKYFKSDLIQRPLRSIYTFGMKNPKEDHLLAHPEAPIIFIVGTHLDKIPEKDSEKILSTLHKVISKEIGNKPYREFVQYDTKGRSFWAVDNTLAGREQSKEFKKYISTLRKMVQEKSMEMSVKIPLPWMLLKLVMDGKRVHYCKYWELMEEARTRGYVREHSASADLDIMLRLFHILGLFYHKVPKGCKKEDSLVFIDPDCLYSATSDFLMATKEEIADILGGSEDGQHQTQAAKKEAEVSQGDTDEGQHQTQAATTEKRSHGEESAEVEIKQKKLQPGIVGKKIIQRMEDNVANIHREMEGVLHIVEETMEKVSQEPTKLVLLLKDLLHSQLSVEQHRLPARESQDAASVKAKWQLFVGKLVHSLASSVKAVLDDSGRNGRERVKQLAKAVQDIKACYQRRSINSDDMNIFLLMLSDLRIIAQLENSDCYVVPAALPKLEGPHSVMFASARLRGHADSIFVTMVSQTVMEMCFLPSGLFCCLISELVTGLGWTVHPLGGTHVAFTHKDLIGQVHVMEHESYIEIKLESEVSLLELAQTCQTVRQKIHDGFIHVYKNFYSDPTADSTFENSLVWGFECEEHPDDKTHIAVFHEDGSGCYAECLLQGCSVVQAVPPAQQVWASDSSLWQPKVTADVDFKITKCVTIQIQDEGAKGQLKPIEKWVEYMHYVTPEKTQSLCISQKSDWKSADNGHVLLHVEVLNQQVYPLPLLITPVHCVYLIAFNLPKEKYEEEKTLKRIHNILKDVYTYSSCEELGLKHGLCHSPKVFLVGLQKEKINKCSFEEQLMLMLFAHRLKLMLKKRSYERLIVFPECGYPYWATSGAELSIHDNPDLLSRIQCYSWRPTQLIHQLLQYHCELLKTFAEGDSFVLYKDVEAKMINVVPGITDSSNFEEFLKLLHCFGLIFYHSFPNLAQSENVVVLQPECLYQLFEEVQKLREVRERLSIADLFTAAAMPIPDHVQKWFQAVCIGMNLVIELPIGNRIDYVFVMNPDPQFDPPSQALYSVDPLLVTYRSQDFVREGSSNCCFLPSPLFPAFVTTLLKELKEYVTQLNRHDMQTDPQLKAMKRHYWHVGIDLGEQGTADIHVVERETFIEIGLQQFHTKTVDQTDEQQLEELQLFCQDVFTIVSKSAKGARDHLKLNKPSIHYGFHVCHSEDSEAVDCFGQFHDKYGTLTCTCCSVPQDPTPQQQIWFSNVAHEKVCYILCTNIVTVPNRILNIDL